MKINLNAFYTHFAPEHLDRLQRSFSRHDSTIKHKNVRVIKMFKCDQSEKSQRELVRDAPYLAQHRKKRPTRGFSQRNAGAARSSSTVLSGAWSVTDT